MKSFEWILSAGSAQHQNAGYLRSLGPAGAVPGIHDEGLCKGV